MKQAQSSETATEQLRRLYRFMSARWFVASRDELAGEGFQSARIKNWNRSGRLIRVLRSVYSYGRDVETLGAAHRAGLLVAGPDSALVGRSACESLGIVRPKPGLPRMIEVGSPAGQAREFRGISPAMRQTLVRVLAREFEPGDFVERNGLTLTKAPLALIEFSARASDREVRFAFLEACRLELFCERDLADCFKRLEGRRGAKVLRPYLALWVPELKRIKSVLEGWFLLVWVKRGLPMPEVNEKVCGYEVDFHWPQFNLVLEVDGDAFHKDPVQKQLDIQKQQHLERQGKKVLRATYREFERDPEASVDLVASNLIPV